MFSLGFSLGGKKTVTNNAEISSAEFNSKKKKVTAAIIDGRNVFNKN